MAGGVLWVVGMSFISHDSYQKFDTKLILQITTSFFLLNGFLGACDCIQ